VRAVGDRSSREFEGGLVIATDRWPVILMDYPEARIPDASLHEALKFHEHLMSEARRAGERVFHVTDLSRMLELAPASQRKYAGEWMGHTLALQRTASLGGANVSPSAIVRGLVTAINWFHQAPNPTVWVATRREAYAIALKAFERAGTRLRPDLHAWLTAAADGQRGGARSSPGKP
jgi:hypothetical protein